MSGSIKAYWYNKVPNVGDSLSPVIISHFLGRKVEWVDKNYTPKLLAIGSIMKALRHNDVVWGSGVMSANHKFGDLSDCKFLAIRGKLTRRILNIDCSNYGDPALLLPLIYNPDVEKKYRVGIVEHYVDKNLYKGEGHKIDILQDTKSFITTLKM